MIKNGTKLTLRPNMTYKNSPEKNEDFGYGENEFGKYMQCQVLDMNAGKSGMNNGFFYVRLYTDLPLAVYDMVTVKDILFIQRKRNVAVFGCTIYEGKTPTIEDDLRKEAGF